MGVLQSDEKTRFGTEQTSGVRCYKMYKHLGENTTTKAEKTEG